MHKQRVLNGRRERRRFRVRKVSRGTAERPRLSVYRSNRNLTVQIVDDELGKTIVAASTQEKDVKTGLPYGGNKNAAQTLGKLVAERALAAGVKAVCFDRGHYKYHGRVAALADAAREAGLSF